MMVAYAGFCGGTNIGIAKRGSLVVTLCVCCISISGEYTIRWATGAWPAQQQVVSQKSISGIAHGESFCDRKSAVKALCGVSCVSQG